ncbi:MAG: hypothetical protein ABIN25_06340 [Ginsengibacter sp.]
MAQPDKIIKEENTVSGFSDKVTRDKINKHLSDINDTISDDDINNVITNINSDSQIDNEIEADNKKAADAILPPDEEAPQMPTTWDMIN